MILDLTHLRHRLEHAPQRVPVGMTPGDVLLGTSDQGEPVYQHRATPERASHEFVLGVSGCGKSALIARALVTEIAYESEDP